MFIRFAEIFYEKAEESISKNIKQHFQGIRNKKTTRSKKSPAKRLRVIFPDERVFFETKATNTFVKVLQHIGLHQISELESITVLGFPLVSTQKNEFARQIREVEGYFVETHSSTKQKVKLIRSIANELNLDISIEVEEKEQIDAE